MKLSIGIPAFNRPNELAQTLESLAPQCDESVEILICEDCSPRAPEIAQVVRQFQSDHAQLAVRYHTNERNLGYDANLRSILDLAKGEYVMFMGDDDRMCPGGIQKILAAISHKEVGVVLRAWQSFDGRTGQEIDKHHYFRGNRKFESGQDTIAAFFRRSVFISGLTVHRHSAVALHTARFDGLLLYQLYLVGMILRTAPAIYLDDIIVERRVGGEHFFGSSSSERGRFQPGKLDPHHSERFLAGLFRIAADLDRDDKGIFRKIRRDLGRYSYPMLEIQAVRQPFIRFLAYGAALARMGLGREPLYWIYLTGLLLVGPSVCNYLLARLTGLIGSTPVLSGTEGEKLSSAPS